MGDITELPHNFIGKDDRVHLEAFGKHAVALGRATRWRWGSDRLGNPSFEMFSYNASQRLEVSVSRDRVADLFRAYDSAQRELVHGNLDHVMAVLDRYLIERSGELPDTPA